MQLKSTLFFGLLLWVSFAVSTFANGEKSAKYTPTDGKILVFVGQDNESVGGTEKWDNGYIDTVGTPAGITHYIYFSRNKTNNFDFTFEDKKVDGLNHETTWGAGPMCLRCYLESAKIKGSVIHLSISMELDDEIPTANGEYDDYIQAVADFMKEFSDYPFLLRIGYEFDGPWNSYEAKPFKQAWRRIVDHLRAQNVDNFATVMASFTMEASRASWEEYWPGDDYVDWLGYSYWSGGTYPSPVLDLAREKNLPVFIAEATPRGFFLQQLNGMMWIDWFDHFFRHIESNKDVIKAISYINANWDAQPMWKNMGWGNSQIQDNKDILSQWKEKMKDPLYVHTNEDVYEVIHFQPEALR